MSPQHLLILRHGQTTMSTAGVYASSTDVELSERGRASAGDWSVLAGARGLHSPLRRSAATAELAGLDSELLDDLTEWDLGDLEGRVSEEYRQQHPGWNLFRDGAPRGEHPADAVQRADRVLHHVSQMDERVVVLVGHGQFSKTLATRVLGLPLDTATKMAWGPCRAALFSWRNSINDYALAGWNRTPAPLEELLEGNN